MGFDYLLYIALGAGIAAGIAFRPRSPWTGRATQATIVVLLFLLGALLSPLPATAFAPSIALAVVFAGLVLGFTILIVALLSRARPLMASSIPADRPGRIPFSVLLVVAVVAGYGVGRYVALPASSALEYVLYVLLFLVGLELRLVGRRLRELWVPLVAAGGGAAIAGSVYAIATGTGWAASFAISFGLGWYSLDGPLVTATLGATVGLVAFLTNFLRENVTMLLAPALGRRLGAETLTAMGGATAMDTTLFFVVRYGDPDAASLALASGLLLTIAAGLVVPAFLPFAH